MADGIEFKIDTTKFEELLKDLPARVARRAVRKALQAGGDVLQEAMRAECPEQTERTPGSDSLPPGILKADLSVSVQVGTKYDPQVLIGPTKDTAYVAWWIDNGFDHVEGGRKTKGGKATKHIDANPFMARAFDSSIGRAVDTMISNLAASLDQDLETPSGADAGDE